MLAIIAKEADEEFLLWKALSQMHNDPGNEDHIQAFCHATKQEEECQSASMVRVRILSLAQHESAGSRERDNR